MQTLLITGKPSKALDSKTKNLLTVAQIGKIPICAVQERPPARVRNDLAQYYD